MHETWARDAVETKLLIEKYDYQRLSPNLFNFVSDDRGLARYRLAEMAVPKVIVPETHIYRYSKVTVSDVNTIFQGETALPISLIDVPTSPSLAELDADSLTSTMPRIKTGSFIFKAGKDNYGHLLIEMLPKLDLLVASGDTEVPLIIPTLPPALKKVLHHVLDTLYPAVFTTHEMTHRFLAVDELIVPGPITKHNTQKSWAVRNFAERLSGKPSTGNLKLYVSRSGGKIRAVTNEWQIELLFRSHGFRVVKPQELSFGEQIALFSRAAHIAGPMGAGLTNIVFAPSDCRVTMLDPGLCDHFFHDLASLKGQVFDWIFTQPLRRSTVEALYEHVRMDVRDVMAALGWIL